MTPFEQWARTAKDFSSQSVWDAARASALRDLADYFENEFLSEDQAYICAEIRRIAEELK